MNLPEFNDVPCIYVEKGCKKITREIKTKKNHIIYTYFKQCFFIYYSFVLLHNVIHCNHQHIIGD